MKLLEKLRQHKKEYEYILPEHPLCKPICARWVSDYTFSFRGQHFTIEAADNEQAWDRAKKLVGTSDALFLIARSAPGCKLRYNLS